MYRQTDVPASEEPSQGQDSQPIFVPTTQGVGASCTVKLRFLHPKNQVKDKIPNQSSSQQLTGLIVQSKAEKIIRKVNKDCIVFRHEDFGRQLVQALQRYVQVDIEGPEQSVFEEETQEPPTAPGEGTNQHNEPSQTTDPANANASNTIPNNAEELHPLIQEMLDRDRNNLDNDDIISVMAAAPMIDDDNQPAPENLLSTEDSTGATDNIMDQWTHSGICDWKATTQRNAKPELTFWMSLLSNPSNLNLFEGLFFSSFIKTTILPQTNQNLPHGEKPILYGEFLCWIGLWMLMGTTVGPQRREFWATSPIDAFHGAPLRLSIWMTRTRFEAILSALTFTDSASPTFVGKFWEVQQMVEAWGTNMNDNFIPGYMNCLDESMSMWTNKFTCPGLMFVPCKPWPFGNKYHTVCCCSSGIMWGIDLVEGKDCPQQLGIQQYDNFGSTVGLLLRMLSPIYHKGFIVILDSGFCVLKGIIELRKKGVFASALIKKRQYWPKYIKGDAIKAHFENKNVGDADSWAGTLDNIPFHVYAMKELDYVMSLMSTYGTNDRDNGKETRRDWKEGPTMKSATFKYPEVIHNHFMFRHAVDDHNGKRHSPISLEVVWATKRWANRVFAFLLSITEVNCFLAQSHFTDRKSGSMLEFRKQLAYKLIENDYLEKEEAALHRRSTRIQEGIGHGLLSLPPFKNFVGTKVVTSMSKYPQKSAIIAKERYAPIAGALQECISAAIALQSIFMMPIMKIKDTS